MQTSSPTTPPQHVGDMTTASQAADLPRPPRARLDSLQIFRGVAAILVVLHHTGTFAVGHLGAPFLGGAFDWGAAGVDFFFVLSGFIIYFVHRRDLGQPGGLRGFAAKRLARIYPIYWVACMLAIPMYLLSPKSGPEFARDPVAIVTSVLLIPQGHFPILSQAWTLTYEMLFYAVFALLIWRWRVFAPVAAAWMAACAGVYVWEVSTALVQGRDTHEILAFPWDWIFSRHNVLFGFGVLGAWLVMRGVGRRWHGTMVWGGVALFAAFAMLNQKGSPFDPAWIFDFPLTFGVASFLVVVGAAASDLATPGRLMPALPLYLGNASYSIYLFHALALSVLVRPAAKLVESHRMGVDAACVLMCVLAVAAGCAVHTIIERPLLRFVQRRVLSGRSADT